jgi:hypothetical protein
LILPPALRCLRLSHLRCWHASEGPSTAVRNSPGEERVQNMSKWFLKHKVIKGIGSDLLHICTCFSQDQVKVVEDV